MALQANEASSEERKDEEARGCNGRPLRTCVTWTFLLVFLGFMFTIWYYGPTAVLRYLLRLPPRKPGWDWCIGLIIVTILSIVMISPIWPPLCMAAGLLFGFWQGLCMNIVSIWTAAAISFVIGRFILREPVRNWIFSGDYPEVRRMMAIMEDENDALKVQILFRFLFIPMVIRNYGPATLAIPFWKLLVGCIPHCIWISVLFASLGATFSGTAELLRDGKEFSFEHIRWQQGAIFIVSFCVAIVLACYAHYKYREKLALDDEAASIAMAAAKA